jgi:hypothetical protein
MGITGGASDGEIIEIIPDIVPDTYTDISKCKTYLAIAMFNAVTIEADIAAQAINARDKINAFLGRSICFTPAELAETQFAGIVDAASQMAACFVQQNPQAAAVSLTEDTKVDCAEAYRTLKNWALANGVELPDDAAKPKHIATELVYEYNNPAEAI